MDHVVHFTNLFVKQTEFIVAPEDEPTDPILVNLYFIHLMREQNEIANIEMPRDFDKPLPLPRPVLK